MLLLFLHEIVGRGLPLAPQLIIASSCGNKMVALLLPAPVATKWLHYYCQLLWQQNGCIIIASSCGSKMVALLLPAPVAAKWLHYYCQLLWHQNGCIIIA